MTRRAQTGIFRSRISNAMQHRCTGKLRELMIRLSALLVFVFTLALSARLMAQTGPIFKRQIALSDSLLLQGDTESAREHLKQAVAMMADSTADSATVAYLQKYDLLLTDLVAYLNEVARLNSDQLARMVEQGKLVGNQFTAERAGVKAAAAYDRFLTCATDLDSQGAISCLRLARLFQLLDAEQLRAEARNRYGRSQQSLHDLDPYTARAVLDSIPEELLRNPALTSFADSVILLDKRVTKALTEAESNRSAWQQTGLVGRRFVIRLATGLFSPPDPGGFPVQVITETETMTFEQTDVSSGARFGFGFSGWVPLTDVILIGGGGFTTDLTFTRAHTSLAIQVETKMEYTELFAAGRWITRPQAGMRPFFQFGFGWMKLKHDGFEGIGRTIHAEPMPYRIDALSESSTMITIGLGAQFVRSVNSRIGVSSVITYRHQLDDPKFLKSPGVSIDIGLDLLI